MKRLFRVLIVFTGVIFATAGIVGVVPPAFAADTNNFTISSYDIEYQLARDIEGRSILKTVETITAEFPEYDQNHGLERALLTTYDGHSTNLTIDSITDENGAALEYSTNSNGGVEVLRIGNKNTYVHGTNTYRITYTQQDVTKYFENTKRDEWYWDTNGTEWRVPIAQLTVTATINDALQSSQVGVPSCYVGAESSTDTCEVVSSEKGVYKTSVQNLSAGENVTLAFGFNPETFAQYSAPLWVTVMAIWTLIQVLAIPVALVLITVFSILYHRKHNRASELQPVPAQYIPPKDASVIVSAQVVGRTVYAFSAQLIDLAVRRYISIVETKEKSVWRVAEYDIVITADPVQLRSEEQEILSDMFGHLPKVGERLALASLKDNMTYRMRTLDNNVKLKALLQDTYKLRQKVPGVSKFFYRWALALTILAIIMLSPPLLFATFFLWICGALIRPLTDDGLRLRRYVLGLDTYIKASETERLKFLQGPDTAEKIGYQVDTSNPGELVKLYERTLPYAILFNREKQWSQQLGGYYQQANTSPDWYAGTTAFNAAVFASTVSSFAQASTYSAGSSSSSGGSSGGGSSGGGGGGGGGGGW